jgi:hypothetical protein
VQDFWEGNCGVCSYFVGLFIEGINILGFWLVFSRHALLLVNYSPDVESLRFTSSFLMESVCFLFFSSLFTLIN